MVNIDDGQVYQLVASLLTGLEGTMGGTKVLFRGDPDPVSKMAASVDGSDATVLDIDRPDVPTVRLEEVSVSRLPRVATVTEPQHADIVVTITIKTPWNINEEGARMLPGLASAVAAAVADHGPADATTGHSIDLQQASITYPPDMIPERGMAVAVITIPGFCQRISTNSAGFTTPT